jgi:hypothetical protein
MRTQISFLTSIATLAALATTAGAQTPNISGTAGSGSNTYFFVMDFRDFAAPQSYAFTFKTNAASETFEQILQGLAPVPTFSSLIATGSQFGDSLNGLAYAGKTKFNDFAGNNSGEPNGYWSQWNGTDGATWSSDQVGISSQSISAGQWAGASWTSDFNTVTDAAPRTPFLTAGAAPEPTALALVIATLPLAGAAIIRRRRHVNCR